MPIDVVNWSRKDSCNSVNSPNRGQLDHGLHLPLEMHRQHDGASRQGREHAGAYRNDIVGKVGDQDAASVAGALADKSLAELETCRVRRLAPFRVNGEQRQDRLALVGIHLVDNPLMGTDQRRQLRQQHLADQRQVALPLQHVGEARQVGLQPVLLGVALGGEPEVIDHRVDVILELSHFAARVDLDRARQVTLGDGGRHLGDGAHLRRQVGCQQVDVAGQVLPGSRGARNIRLTAETAFHAHLARNRGHLIGKGRERVGHVVDGLGKGCHLALGCDGEILLEVAVRHRRHHLDDAADLLGQVGGHDVDGVGQVFPGA